MAYKKGQGGRPKGARNKRTVEFEDALKQKDFSPALALIQCYNRAISDYKYYRKRVRQGFLSPMEDNSHKNLKIAADLAKELASYSYPKLKSVEQVKVPTESDRPLEKMSDEELDKL